MNGEMDRASLQDALGLKHKKHFLTHHLHPAIVEGWIEMTIPNKPNSRLQKYRLTAKGRDVFTRGGAV